MKQLRNAPFSLTPSSENSTARFSLAALCAPLRPLWMRLAKDIPMRQIILSFFVLSLLTSGLYFTPKSSAQVSTTIASAGTPLSTQNNFTWKYPVKWTNCSLANAVPFAAYTFDVTTTGAIATFFPTLVACTYGLRQTSRQVLDVYAVYDTGPVRTLARLSRRGRASTHGASFGSCR